MLDARRLAAGGFAGDGVTLTAVGVLFLDRLSRKDEAALAAAIHAYPEVRWMGGTEARLEDNPVVDGNLSELIAHEVDIRDVAPEWLSDESQRNRLLHALRSRAEQEESTPTFLALHAEISGDPWLVDKDEQDRAQELVELASFFHASRGVSWVYDAVVTLLIRDFARRLPGLPQKELLEGVRKLGVKRASKSVLSKELYPALGVSSFDGVRALAQTLAWTKRDLLGVSASTSLIAAPSAGGSVPRSKLQGSTVADAPVFEAPVALFGGEDEPPAANRSETPKPTRSEDQPRPGPSNESRLRKRLAVGLTVALVVALLIWALYVKMAPDEAGGGRVAVGQYHACFVTATGGLQCWYEDDHGCSRWGPPGHDIGIEAPIVGVSAGSRRVCAVSVGGPLWCWGTPSSSTAADLTARLPKLLGKAPPAVDVRLLGRRVCVLTPGEGRLVR